MGSLHPYLQRRSNRLYFRISVPAALRPLIGVRELTSALKTSDRTAALPVALSLGATAHRLFNELHFAMSKKDLLEILKEAKLKFRIDALRAEMDEQVLEAHSARIAGIQNAKRDAASQLAILEVQNATLKDALNLALTSRGTSLPGTSVSSSEHDPVNSPAAQGTAESNMTLQTLIEKFLDGYGKDRKPAMFKKQQAALELLRELHGSKQISSLRQKDIVQYFDVVEGLPPRWAEKAKKLRTTARALSQMEHEATLGKKTFEDNYVVPLRLFLIWARRNWQDEGFPSTLTTDGTEYEGDGEEGSHKQRAMHKAELTKLFHEVLAPYAHDPEEEHKWWLPVLAFYSGARVNELCQINPLVDLGVSSDGIQYLRISEDTEADPRIKKSVKTGDERYVPLHPDLVAGGFLDYVERMRAKHSKLLFPAWSPTKRRASIQAERWFRDLLRDSGLRDDTLGARLVGFHAFRHTLLTRAADSTPSIDAGALTGHTDSSKGGSQRGYEGERSLPHKLKLLQGIQFDFRP